MPHVSFEEWLKSQIDAEPYWFHRIELFPNLITPGWSNPVAEKVPHFGLPADLTGLRVLDVGAGNELSSSQTRVAAR